MKHLVPLLLCLFTATAGATGKVSTKKIRVNGNWEVHCEIAYPQNETQLAKAIGYLRTQCEIAALRLSVKQHARSGTKFAAQVSKEQIDTNKTEITMIARLVVK